MRIKSFLITLLCIIGGYQLQAQILKKVVGNDNYVTREYKLNDFSKVSISEPFNVIYKVNPDSAGVVRIYGEENILDIISLKSEKGNLSMKINGVRTPEFGAILVHMYSSNLNTVINEGGATFEIQSPLENSEIRLSLIGAGQIKAEKVDCGVLNLSLSGSGDIYVAGKAGMGDYAIQGSGEIRAADVFTDEAKAIITGTGVIKCSAEKTLKTILTGSGKVYYKGNPTLKTRTVGTGQVIPMK